MMAKILMVQLQAAPYAGTAYLNAAASAGGHRLVLHLGTAVEAVLGRIEAEKPDIIGFSCMSPLYRDVLALTKEIKSRYETPIIIGGPHPTLFPDVIDEPSIDIICRGEGEFPLMELLAALDKKEPITGIPNLWVKDGGKVHKNPLRPLIDPLDEAPLIDWSCYKGTGILENSPPTVFLIRGCPYSCTYCFNETMRGMYAGKGRYVRHFSTARSIAEVKEALKHFSPSPVLFTSDSFGIDLDWMEEMLDEYDKATDLPFVLLLRPELASQRCVDILAKHRCYSVAIGVESGSERVRREVMNRQYGNKDLLDVAGRLHGRGIRFRTYNMLGLPTETDGEMWETVDVNVEMGTDFPRASIFTPLPNTRIVEIAQEHGYLDPGFCFDNIPNTILSNTVLKGVDGGRLQNMLYFFQTAVIFPRMRALIRRLVGLRPNPLFKAWFYLVYAYLHVKSEDRNVLAYLRYIYLNRHYR
jgi:anaerobic magnesium-protoporphyrin IX monomethyl ester cyclase